MTASNSSDPLLWLKRWWSDKYNLPMNDSRLENLDIRELFSAYLFDLKDRRDELMGLIQSSDRDLNKDMLRKQLKVIDAQLTGTTVTEAEVGGARVTGDPLVDEWERQAEAGEIPDMWAGMSPREAEKWRKKLEKK